MDLLVEILKAGSIQSPNANARPYFCEDIESLHCQELMKLGLVVSRDDAQDVLQATPRATSNVQLTQSYISPTPICEYVSDPPPLETEMTVLDLLFALLRGGWQEVRLERKTAHDPYKDGSEKKVLYTASLGKAYLLALWKSQSLFEKGVREIYYFQLESYYQALLDCQPHMALAVRPNLTLQDYKHLSRGMNPPSRDRHVRRNELVDDEGWLAVLAVII